MINLLALLDPTLPPVDLHADLAAYLQAIEHGMIALRHPLVYDVPYSPKMNRLLNARYEVLQTMADAAIAQRAWIKILALHQRPFRASKLHEFAQQIMDESPKLFWEILASVWVDTENYWQNIDEWRDLWQEMWDSDEIMARHHVMQDDEQAVLAALPDRLRVYRGVKHPAWDQGLAWTLDRKQARWFAKRAQHADERPCVVTGDVAKADVLAYFTGEREIITFPEHVKIIRRDSVS